jgi:hypothetical protein
VIAGGDELLVMRPAAENILTRKMPPAIGSAVVVIAEPWAPRRFAVATRGRISVFEGREPEVPTVQLDLAKPEYDATHLAWLRENGESVLYFRRRDGEVGRLWVDRGVEDVIDCPPMAAIASDESGALALLTLVPGEENVWVSQEGGFEVRPLTTVPVGDDLHVHLAVRGAAVAYSLDDCWGTYVSWDREQDFDRCEALWGGPIAFQGDDALFGAYCVETNASIFRETRDGTTARIADIEAEGVGPWQERSLLITALAWDASRRTLWGASPQAGLIRSREPAKGERVPLS